MARGWRGRAAAVQAEQVVVGSETAADVLGRLPAPSQVVWVRSAADLPAAVAGVRTLAADVLYIVVAAVDLGEDVLEAGARCAIFGSGGGTSQLSTDSVLPLLTGRRVVIRDVALLNASGACLRVEGQSAADPLASLRASGVAVAGDDADGVVQIHDVEFAAFHHCRWVNCAGVGLRTTGTCRSVSAETGLSRGNGTGFVWADVPAGATLAGKLLVADMGFDLADGGVGVRVEPASLVGEALHLESCLFPDPATPGIGAPLATITAEDPGCHLGSNLNLENTHRRGGLSISSNATATTIGGTVLYYALAGTTTLRDSSGFDSPAAGQLRYTGTGSIRVQLGANVTLSTASPNQDLVLAFARTPDGGAATVLEDYLAEDITDGTTLRTGNLSLTAWLVMNSGDVVDLRVRNRTGANNVTWLHGQVTVAQVGG